MGKRVAPRPKPSEPEPPKKKAARPEEAPIVKSLKDKKGKPILTPVDEPLTNFVSVEDVMGFAIKVKHVADNEDLDMQTSAEEEGLGVKWNDLPAAACAVIKELFSFEDQINAPMACLRIMLQREKDLNTIVRESSIDVIAKNANPSEVYQITQKLAGNLAPYDASVFKVTRRNDNETFILMQSKGKALA